jgi:hypothetical protein
MVFDLFSSSLVTNRLILLLIELNKTNPFRIPDCCGKFILDEGVGMERNLGYDKLFQGNYHLRSNGDILFYQP